MIGQPFCPAELAGVACGSVSDDHFGMALVDLDGYHKEGEAIVFMAA